MLEKIAEMWYRIKPPSESSFRGIMMQKYLMNLALKYTNHETATDSESTHGAKHWVDVAYRSVHIAKQERKLGHNVSSLEAFVAGMFHDFGRKADYANDQGHEQVGAQLYQEKVMPHLKHWNINHDRIIHALASGAKQDPSDGDEKHYLSRVVEDADRYTVDDTTGVEIHHDYINTHTGMKLVKAKQFWQKLKGIKFPTWEETMAKYRTQAQQQVPEHAYT